MNLSSDTILYLQLGFWVLILCLLFWALGLGLGALIWRRHVARGLELVAENEDLRRRCLERKAR